MKRDVVRYRKRTRTDGIWELVWTDPENGKIRRGSCKTRDEHAANRKLAEKILTGEVVPPEAVTIDYILDRYFHHIKRRKSANTVIPMNSKVARLKDYFGDINWKDFSQSDVENYIDHAREITRWDRGAKPLSNGTIRKDLEIHRSALRHAHLQRTVPYETRIEILGLPTSQRQDWLMVHRDGGYKFRYTRHIIGGSLTPLQVTVPIGIAGSGKAGLIPFDQWKRPLLRLVAAYNRKKVNGHTVANKLAEIAYKAHLETKDGTVGPDSFVVWRNSKGRVHKGGGGHAFFSCGERSEDGSIPLISRGTDMTSFVKIVMEEIAPQFDKFLEAIDKGQDPPELDSREREINERLSKLPSKPDEKLR